jgi:hypothetical protein
MNLEDEDEDCHPKYTLLFNSWIQSQKYESLIAGRSHAKRH